MNSTIQEKMRIMLNLAQGFWVKEVAIVLYLITRSPIKVLDNVAKMVWSRKVPSYKHLRIFGCKAHGHITKEFRTRSEPKSRKYIKQDGLSIMGF